VGLEARVHSAAGAGLAAAVVVLAGVVRREVGEMMFTEEDLAKIRTAVCEAERRTRGEIVPMIVPRSAQYREAGHALGVIFALITLSTLLLWDRPDWGGILSPAWILLAVVVAYGVGDYAGLLPATIRLLTSKERIDSAVRRRAEAAFYEHGLHKTREGTGILIMLSLLERRVQVLADKAINERVPPSTWDQIVQELVAAIQEGRPTEGFCRAIEKCGDLLAVHFPARPSDNPDELSDDLIQER
jgi:putative membrane protein